jgi:hypothetical protein
MGAMRVPNEDPVVRLLGFGEQGLTKLQLNTDALYELFNKHSPRLKKGATGDL